MALYKGIPFNGGMDSPSGTGAQNIVETCQAICDWATQADAAGILKDSTGTTAVDWAARALFDANSTIMYAWGSGVFFDTSGTHVVFNVQSGILYDPNQNASIDAQNRDLLDDDGTTVQLSWAGGLAAPNLPTTDPLDAGKLWNNLGIVTVSAG